LSRDDRQLLIRTRDGHEPAARLLWERHAPRLIAYARSILPPSLSPEDTVQSVFCRVVALDRAAIGAVQDVPAWLTSLVRREALNAVRAARRERARVERAGAIARSALREEGGSGTGAAPGVGNAPATHEALHRALESLPRRLREVVTLKHVCGLTFDQTAHALSVPRGTAAARYRVAIVTLRGLLMRSRASTSAPVEALHG